MTSLEPRPVNSLTLVSLWHRARWNISLDHRSLAVFAQIFTCSGAFGGYPLHRPSDRLTSGPLCLPVMAIGVLLPQNWHVM